MKKAFFLLLFGLIAPAAFAITLPTDLAGAALDAALKTVTNNLETVAIKILFSLSLLQFCITGVGLFRTGEIDASIGKFAMAVTWTGFCVWLLSSSGNADGLSNGGHFIQSSVDGFISMAGSWTATQGSSFNTGDIMMTGLFAYGQITLSVAKVTATNLANAASALFVPGVALLTIIMTFAISMVVLITCAYIALKVFMVKLELGIVVAMAPLSISLLGLTALREQGFAPFKSMLALIYRTVVLGATVSAMSTVAKFLSDYVNSQAYGISADVWGPLIGAAFGFVILAFVAHKSDSIAASLANGSSSMGSGDVASAAAIGAAVGAAVMTGGASAAAGATKAPQAMADFMKGIGGSGSVSNASRLGAGGSNLIPGPPDPMASKAGGQDYPLNSHGAPIAPPGSEAPAQAFTSGPDLDAVASTPRTTPNAPVPASPGSDSSAGIGGVGRTAENQKASQKPSLIDRLSTVNQHVAQENASTHVSINTHHSD